MKILNTFAIDPEDRLAFGETQSGLIEIIITDPRDDARVKIITTKEVLRNIIRGVFKTIYEPENLDVPI